jgi:hypothetical protein
MITRVTKGNCFRGVLAYALMSNKRPHILCSTLMTQDRAHWATEFELQASRNSRVKQAVFHYIKSLAPGEHLTDDQWTACIQEDAKALGFDQYIGVLHRDRAHDHADIIVNAVLADGRTWAQRQDRVKLRATANAQEIRYNLTRTRSVSDRPGVGKQEIEKAARLFEEGRTNTPIPAKILVREAVAAACAQAKDLDEVIEILVRQSITTRARIDNGQVVGVSFGLGSQAYSGSSIGMPLKSLRARFPNDNTRFNSTGATPAMATGISGRDRTAGCTAPDTATHDADCQPSGESPVDSDSETPHPSVPAQQIPSGLGFRGTDRATADSGANPESDAGERTVVLGATLLVLILQAVSQMCGNPLPKINIYRRRRRRTVPIRPRLPK